MLCVMNRLFLSKEQLSGNVLATTVQNLTQADSIRIIILAFQNSQSFVQFFRSFLPANKISLTIIIQQSSNASRASVSFIKYAVVCIIWPFIATAAVTSTLSRCKHALPMTHALDTPYYNHMKLKS